MQLLSGCTTAPSNITPLMWRVTHAESEGVVYLFGSVHIGREDMYPLPTAIMEAFFSSDYLAVESNLRRHPTQFDVDERIRIGTFEDGETIVDVVGFALHEKAKEILIQGGYEAWLEYGAIAPGKTLDNFRPLFWMELLANVSGPDFRYHGLSGELGIDWYFKGIAINGIRPLGRHRKQILEIENGLVALKVQFDFPNSLQKILFENSLDAELNVEHSIKVIDAWSRGDFYALRELRYIWYKKVRGVPDELMVYVERACAQRGAVMVEAAKRYMANGQNVFFITGANHMVREGGIVETLMERGFTVEQVVWW